MRGHEEGSPLNSPRTLALEQECDELKFKCQALEEQVR